MIGYLWRHRERPALLSKRWCVVWAKRVLLAPALLQLLWRAGRLRVRGAAVGKFVVIEKCRIDGPASNLVIGDGAFIGMDSELALHDRVAIGAQAVINRRVTILTASHDLKDPHWRMYRKPVEIGDYAWIATGAMLLPGVRIGRGAVVGAGAVVRKDVPDYAVVSGNPATLAGAERCHEFSYSPAASSAMIEAWLGGTGFADTAGNPRQDLQA